MLMAGLGDCGGPRVSHRGREGAGRAGHGGGVFEGRGHSSGAPCPSRRLQAQLSSSQPGL